ncbi:MAG: sugar ABC transporter permease [Lachnospiraceae bacterium]|jgi:ABC-type sugar transport system permease subunit|nr:sugar ABC transporter permease [Lachnospiraceae bacterium]
MPFILGFLFFMVKPFFQSLYMSFCKVDISAQGVAYTFSGLENYKRALLIDPEFNQMLTDEVWRMVINSISTIIFSLFVALMLNRKFKGRAFVRAVFFLPVIFSSGIIVGLDANNAVLSSMAQSAEAGTGNSVTAVLEQILTSADIGSGFMDTIFEVVNRVYDIAIASGIQIIIFLSALQTIPQSMYEAAEIEGCTKWESLWKITLPMISSMFLVNWIYTIIDFFTKTDNQIMEKIRIQISTYMAFDFGSALAWIYFAVVMVMIGVSALIITRVVYYYE